MWKKTLMGCGYLNPSMQFSSRHPRYLRQPHLPSAAAAGSQPEYQRTRRLEEFFSKYSYLRSSIERWCEEQTWNSFLCSFVQVTMQYRQSCPLSTFWVVTSNTWICTLVPVRSSSPAAKASVPEDEEKVSPRLPGSLFVMLLPSRVPDLMSRTTDPSHTTPAHAAHTHLTYFTRALLKQGDTNEHCSQFHKLQLFRNWFPGSAISALQTEPRTMLATLSCDVLALNWSPGFQIYQIPSS